MTVEEFDNQKWTAGMNAKYKGEVYPIGSADFEEKLVAIDEYHIGSEYQWKRCENIELV